MREARAFRRAGRGKSASPVRRGESGSRASRRPLSYSTGSVTEPRALASGFDTWPNLRNGGLSQGDTHLRVFAVLRGPKSNQDLRLAFRVCTKYFFRRVSIPSA